MRNIVSKKDIVGGSPTIDGTRLTCQNIVGYFYFMEFSLNEILNFHSNLRSEDIKRALEYCAKRECIKETVLSFCQNCTLNNERTFPPDFYIENIEDFNTFIKNPNGQAFLGTIEDDIDSESYNYWNFAEQILKKEFEDE